MIYIKKISNKYLFEKEVEGYNFFSKYYQKIPAMIKTEISDDGYRVYYEKVSTKGVHLLTDSLNSNSISDIEPLLKELVEIANKHACSRIAGGGTNLFYKNRIDRLLDKDLVNRYSKFVNNYSTVSVNSISCVVNPDLLKKLYELILRISNGTCIPSQGDLHERNVFTNGYIIDFEAGGWNLASTDLSTFLHHTLFAGSYFGPKYARWSTIEDRKALELQPPQLILNNSNVDVRLSPARSAIIEQYFDGYLKKLTFLDQFIVNEVSYLIAYRLLTVFDPCKMTSTDSDIIFILANYFHNSPDPLASKIGIRIVQ